MDPQKEASFSLRKFSSLLDFQVFWKSLQEIPFSSLDPVTLRIRLNLFHDVTLNATVLTIGCILRSFTENLCLSGSIWLHIIANS